MTCTYIALGINPGGTILVLAPMLRSSTFSPVTIMLCDIEVLGLPAFTNRLGHVLLSALGAFQPALDRYGLLSAPLYPGCFPTPPPPHALHPALRALHMGLDLANDAAEPALLLQAYDGGHKIGHPSRQPLKHFAALEAGSATAIIGAAMLRGLAALHPDAMASR